MHWSVTPPSGATPGDFTLASTLRFSVDGVTQERVSETRVTVPKSPPDGTVALSDLTWLDASNGYGPALKDRNYYGDPLSIAGTVYPKGLWTHPAGHLGYYLGARCRNFSTDLGIDDSQGNKGSVVFSVYVDGELAYRSPVLHGADPVAHADVDVSGAQSLAIEVSDAGDGVTSDNADWGAPTLTCGDAS